MNILILGANGFIGQNLFKKLVNKDDYHFTLVDRNYPKQQEDDSKTGDNIKRISITVDDQLCFDDMTENADIVYHLLSTNYPFNSNSDMKQNINNNIIMTSNLLDSCVKNNVKKVVFISSGGTVYGVTPKNYRIKENHDCLPISGYGFQKVTIEKLLFYYNYNFGLDYRTIRLSNPYGPYQKSEKGNGVISAFIKNAVSNKKILVYGDGSEVRDYIYIDDAIDDIEKIVNYEGEHKIFNVGTGIGTSINQLIGYLKDSLNLEFETEYVERRKSDIPYNILDISRLDDCCGPLQHRTLLEGISETYDYIVNR